jgi:beta-glucosidase
MRRFPEGFRWGTATAAHQVEGNNVNNDWWEWEHREGTVCVEPSGDACDQYHRYPEDLRLLGALGFDNYRFSVEWSRIEPEEGAVSKAALDHYRRVCAECLANDLQPVVTFHHFTTPRWVANDGGWHDARIVDRFARFCERTVEHLGDLIGRACTINEPNVVSYIGYQVGVFPPGILDADLWRASYENMIAAHRRSYEVLKAGRGEFPVGLTLSMSDYQPVPAEDEKAIATRDTIRYFAEDVFLESCRGDDFIGVQTYSRTRVGPDGQLGPEEGVPVLVMGYEYYPESLAATIRRAWEVTEHVPVLVTENGIGTDDDEQRRHYVERALHGVLDCLDEGIEVLGYTYWSLLDNFEWAFGYGPRFGLVEVDRRTQERRVKPSAYWLSSVVQANALSDGSHG